MPFCGSAGNWAISCYFPQKVFPVGSAFSFTKTLLCRKLYLKKKTKQNIKQLYQLPKERLQNSHRVRQSKLGGKKEQKNEAVEISLILSQREGKGFTCAILSHMCSFLCGEEVVNSCFSLTCHISAAFLF